ncbi:unnamed protein product [Lymnaea stagnalis]|uniref:C2H2-type domain-containing protein n=1 Tax=Lymnaea stagnalis TaxID=6523 RepID=A0AAV2I6P3_LYMST
MDLCNESEEEPESEENSEDCSNITANSLDGNSSDGSKGKDNRSRHQCEKGPPIVCLMCKIVWTKNRKGGRLFMFGGSRPFMAKFEAKFKALMGREELVALQNKSATKFGRSYICRECYLVVRQTYDNIRKVQRDVAKSIQRVKSKMCLKSDPVTEDGDSGSDQDLDIDYQAHNPPKKKLPPVAERIAVKIASLTLVKINNKVPKICLTPITSLKDEESSQDKDNSSDSDSSMSHHENIVGSNNGNEVSDNGKDFHHQQDSENNDNCCISNNLDVTCSTAVSSHQTSLENDTPCQKVGLHIITNNEKILRPLTENVYSSKEAAECSAISLNTNTSFASQHNINENTDLSLSSEVNTSQNRTAASTDIISDKETESRDQNDNSRSPSLIELAEILANPLLLIKSPQPLKLADVKDEQAYICGEGNCDWIFSSKFFWENHIRHYHRFGKPFICPFEGCSRSFSGKSKLELHVRSHTDERPFICDKCGSGFRGNQELKAHRLTHTSEKPHQCPKCDKNFKLLSSLKRHLQFHDGGDFPFPCTYPECGKAFKSKYDLKCHDRLHTGEKPYKCPEPGCGMAFRIPCQFTMHKRSHTGERPFRCNVDGCSAAYISSNALQAHMLSHTSERPLCCEFCGKTFKHKMLYRMHLKKHSEPQSFVCPVEGCGEEHADRRSLDQHMASNHGIQDYKPLNKKVFECTEVGCGLRYSTDGGLRYHKLRVHNSGNLPIEEEPDSRKLSCPFDKCERVYEDADSLRDHLAKAHMPIPREKMCPLCGLAFPHTEQLELHIHTFHNESSILNEHLKGIFVCNSERCGLRFHRLEELKHHVNWHLGNPPYRCEYDDCARTFLLETMFSQHITEHENLKPFTCSFDHCSEGFTSYLKVLKHTKMHYGLFRCPLDGCSKAMQTLSNARMHLQRHEKPFVCLMCGKRFALSEQWNRHKRSHTGEKVYECKVCSSQFGDSESLKLHKKIHKGEKRYMCEECGQRFNCQVSRKNHMKIHSSLRELPYVCPEEGCGKTFRESGSLKAHQNSHTKPSHLCTQCGKVYKFSVSKHRCKVEQPEQLQEEPKIEYLQQLPIQQHPMQQMEMQTVQQLQPLPQMSAQSLPHSVPPTLSLQLPDSIPQPIPLTLQQLPQSIQQSLPQLQPQQVQQQQQQSKTLHQFLFPDNMNNLMMMSEPNPQSYVMEVEEAARAMRQNFGAPDTIVLQDQSHYNYIILYDRPVTQ